MNVSVENSVRRPGSMPQEDAAKLMRTRPRSRREGGIVIQPSFLEQRVKFCGLAPLIAHPAVQRTLNDRGPFPLPSRASQADSIGSRTRTESAPVSAALPSTWTPGTEFSKYEIGSRLAAGGMAEVWRAKI